MIVVSLLLILVAVTLLVLGLTGGSSGLLIGSIVASLLAAVALVVSARQSAAARRAAPSDPAAPPLPDDNAVFVAEPEFAAAADEVARRRPAADQRDTVQFDPADVAATKPSAGPDFAEASSQSSPSSPPGDPYFAARSSDDSYSAARSSDDPYSAARSSGDPYFAARSSDDQPAASDLADQAGAPAGDLSADDPRTADDPDYDRASAAINAARSETPNADAWRRGDASAPEAPADDFAEPADDDPDDEPLPQSVQPADAVRVARLDDEVLVVDGRPRYHVADCLSLSGRLTEPIPVREAVELGFSPCGLCRPVDRLVGASTRR